MSDNANIRLVTATDRPAVLDVLRDAFRRDAEAALVEKLWLGDAIEVERVAEENDGIIGYCSFSAVTATPALPGLLLGLAPLAIANEHQGRGVGKALAMNGLEACRERDAALVVVLGEPEYYSRFGFKPASDHNVGWATKDAGHAFQLIDFAGITGASAHSIDYHPAFSEV